MEHLGATARFPTYLPWPLSPGWRVTDFASVGTVDRGRAAMTCVSGTSSLDGPVDVLVISEEPGTGLGARIAGTVHDDPGTEIGEGPPSMRVRIDSKSIPLWPVSTSAASGEWDRSVVAGEAGAVGCGWCFAQPPPSCCCATTGSCAMCRASGRRWWSCRSEGPRRRGDSRSMACLAMAHPGQRGSGPGPSSVPSRPKDVSP